MCLEIGCSIWDIIDRLKFTDFAMFVVKKKMTTPKCCPSTAKTKLHSHDMKLVSATSRVLHYQGVWATDLANVSFVKIFQFEISRTAKILAELQPKSQV